tara:strand:- start:6599 stop:6961 length:363 start_codon:yes stop_codon:yes gene_type:complete
MSSPTALISLRLTEEQILGLDQRVGTDGFRNRSDVVRESVRRFLSEVDYSSTSMEIQVGLDLSKTLERFCALRSEDVEAVFQAGARLYMQREMEIAKNLDRAIEDRIRNLSDNDDDSLRP